MAINAEEVREKIVKSLSSSDNADLRIEDIAFHMTDWVDDLIDLVDFYDSPAKYDDERVSALLIKFLVHAPPHIAAASKLFLDNPVTDVFGVDAVSENKN